MIPALSQSFPRRGFPESYKNGLRQIHAQYPNWTFTAVKTGLDWNTVIQNEGVLGRNLVHTNSISSYKSLADGAYNWDSGTWTGFDGSTWVAASTEIISYYMDPRNFLDGSEHLPVSGPELQCFPAHQRGLTVHAKGNVHGRECEDRRLCVRQQFIGRQFIRKQFFWFVWCCYRRSGGIRK